jgi:transcriptional regulatory protein LevR
MVTKIYLGVEGGARDLTLKCYDKDGPKILALIKHSLTALLQKLNLTLPINETCYKT